MNWYLKVITKYADFNGRARRKEYWMFALFNTVFSVLAVILDNVLELTFYQTPYGPVYIVYVLAVCLPGLAVSVRRLHDVGKSGFMIFVSFIPVVGTIWLLVLMVTDSYSEENEYGEVPKVNYEEDKKTTNSNGDIIILISVIWMFISRFFWMLISRFGGDYYNSGWFTPVTTGINIVWALIPIALAFAVNDKNKRIILFVLSGLYIVFDVYNLIFRYI